MAVEIGTERRNRELRRASEPDVSPRRALVIDGDPAALVLIQDALGSADIDSVTLNVDAEINGHILKNKFDVILVGLAGPYADGIELVREIRRAGLNRTTPIIAISDDLRPGALPRSFEAGASFFVYKPIDKARLMRIIRATQGTIEHEKRRFRRVPVCAKVRLKSSQDDLEGETIDISLGGALVRVSRTLPVGALVEVSLYLLGDTNPVVGRGSVVRVIEDNQMGILLDRLPLAESGRLQEYLLPRISD